MQLEIKFLSYHFVGFWDFPNEEYKRIDIRYVFFDHASPSLYEGRFWKIVDCSKIARRKVTQTHFGRLTVPTNANSGLMWRVQVPYPPCIAALARLILLSIFGGRIHWYHLCLTNIDF